ncbi:hypothetical protein AGDE_09486 [Angomonas deanei]|nr:hypothetical protein AGDE_09486 [Angomonas deanei]|eukprot:EPY30353.1 hypothetical protein AGDE_09486 [Angomonas deanei]
MLRAGKRLIAPSKQTNKKYTVVFDLDETVVYARDGPLYSRAYLRDLLRSIKDDFEIVVWTAGERDYAKTVLEEINEDLIIDHLVYRHQIWFNQEDYTKDLRRLGRDLDFTIMVENTPDCLRVNPQNGIIVEDFEVAQEETDEESSVLLPEEPPEVKPGDKQEEEREETSTPKPAKKRVHTDRTLYLLKEVLLELAKSEETVPKFLAKCELLSHQVVVGSDGKEIPIYHLGTRRRRKDAGTPRKVVKENRDKISVTPPTDRRKRPREDSVVSDPPPAELSR